MATDRFGEKIILLNKENVCFFVNAKSDEFVRQTVALNILLLWSYKKVVSRALYATFFGNCNALVTKLSDISFLIKYISNNSKFKEKLGYTSIQINTAIFVFSDLFYIGATHLFDGKVLSRYIR